MQTMISGAGMLGMAVLAQLDVDGFLRSDTFLSALAQFISSIIVQVLNLLLFGGTATLGG